MIRLSSDIFCELSNEPGILALGYLRIFLYNREYSLLEDASHTNSKMLQLSYEKPLLCKELGYVFRDMRASICGINSSDKSILPKTLFDLYTPYIGGESRWHTDGGDELWSDGSSVWNMMASVGGPEEFWGFDEKSLCERVECLTLRHFNTESFDNSMYDYLNGAPVDYPADTLGDFCCHFSEALDILVSFGILTGDQEIPANALYYMICNFAIDDRLIKVGVPDITIIKNMNIVLSLKTAEQSKHSELDEAIENKLSDYVSLDRFDAFCFMLGYFSKIRSLKLSKLFNENEAWLINNLKKQLREFLGWDELLYSLHYLRGDIDYCDLDAEAYDFYLLQIPFPLPIEALSLLYSAIYLCDPTIAKDFLSKCSEELDPLLSESKVLELEEESSCRLIVGDVQWQTNQKGKGHSIQRENSFDNDADIIKDISLAQLCSYWLKGGLESSTDKQLMIELECALKKYIDEGNRGASIERIDLAILKCLFEFPAVILDALSKMQQQDSCSDEQSKRFYIFVELCTRCAMCLPMDKMNMVLQELKSLFPEMWELESAFPNSSDFYRFFFAISNDELKQEVSKHNPDLAEAIFENLPATWRAIKKLDPDFEFGIDLVELQAELE